MALLPDTTRRHLEPELMDSPTLGREPHRIALLGLARINVVSRSATAIWSALRGRLNSTHGRALRVLDLACGGGDIAVELRRVAALDAIDLEVDGCDVSEQALQLARERSPRTRFLQCDALAGDLPGGYDAMISNLFLHHLSRDCAAGLLQRMSEAAPVIVVNDLARGKAAYAAAYVGTRLLSRSPIVHIDGPRSVRAAFTVEEARSLAREAGLTGARVTTTFPWRWLLDWGRE